MDDSTNQQNVKAPSADKKSEYDELREIEEGKAGAILGYIPFLCFIPLIMMKDNKFAVKHGKQGLLLLLIELLAFVFLFPSPYHFGPHDSPNTNRIVHLTILSSNSI